MKTVYSWAVILLFSVFADAQTLTVVNPAGATVVEVVTQNPLGVPTTQILQTLGTSSTSQTLTSQTLTTPSTTGPQRQTTAQTTSTQAQVGPVGQPGTTPVTPGGPTPYEYTTVDAQGDTTVLQGIFTPTTPPLQTVSQTLQATVLDLSQFLSQIGTNTAPASAARRVSIPVATGWYCFAATAFAGLVGGAWLVVF